MPRRIEDELAEQELTPSKTQVPLQFWGLFNVEVTLEWMFELFAD